MPLNVAIDGPVGAGKSTIADAVARRLGILHLDTGAMYRAAALAALERGVPSDDEKALEELLPQITIDVLYMGGMQHTLIDGRDVSGLIRTPEVSMAASGVSRFGAVRSHMVALQQRLAKATPMVVDGRDIGTRVLPEADIKIFLTASAQERAHRRYLELVKAGKEVTYEEVLRDLNQRDLQDTTRAIDPLRPAQDAVTVDTTDLNQDQAVERILAIVEARHGKAQG